ncbi:MAG: hypothetical protein U5K69_23690 [Balneolaceae bacterium]|nr:hypothetical protein [Balneolaceae bacterium]
MTVTGPVEPSELGMIMPHEHVLVDFIGADSISKDRYAREDVVELVQPYLSDLKEAGGHTLIECTPNYLGRDPLLLQTLAKNTGVQLLTNTGYYGDEAGKYLPDHVYSESAEQIAKRWQNEWDYGIGERSVRPGFIKMRVDQSPISDTGRKLLEAAAIVHKNSGLTIGVHTPNGETALEQIEILEANGVSPSAFIWIHAQNEDDSSIHIEAARRGAWVELDGIGAGSAEYHLQFLLDIKEAGLLDHVLISQDAGWYRVGEPNGAPEKFTPYTYLINSFIPMLKEHGFTSGEIEQLTVTNPQRAFTISKRVIES